MPLVTTSPAAAWQTAFLAAMLTTIPSRTGRAQAGFDTVYDRAVSSLYGSARIAEFVEDWCASRTPEFKDANALAGRQWRRDQGLVDIETHLAKLRPEQRRHLDQILQSQRAEFYRKLDASGPPRATCKNLAGFLAEYLDLRSQQPRELEILAQHQARPDEPAIASEPKLPLPSSTPPFATRTGGKTGISPDEIEGVYLEQRTGFGAGGMMTIQYDPVLLLKDGWAYDGWTASPTDLDVAASRRTEPNAWRRYQWRGGQTWIQDRKGGWSTFDRKHRVVPAQSGDRLIGRFSHLGGGGNTAVGGNTMIAVSRSYTFGRDGTFTSAAVVGVSGGNEATDPNGPPGVVATSQRSSQGTYQLDGYTLELRYDNGRVIRKAFVWFDERARDSIFLDGIAFLLDK